MYIVGKYPYTHAYLFQTHCTTERVILIKGMPPSNASAKKQLFDDIQDIVGDAKLWPKNIREWLWLGASYAARPLLVAFFYVNGLNPEVFLDWCVLTSAWTVKDSRHAMYLFKTLEAGHHLQYLYAYNVTLGHYQYVNGTYYGKKQQNSEVETVSSASSHRAKTHVFIVSVPDANMANSSSNSNSSDSPSLGKFAALDWILEKTQIYGQQLVFRKRSHHFRDCEQIRPVTVDFPDCQLYLQGVFNDLSDDCCPTNTCRDVLETLGRRLEIRVPLRQLTEGIEEPYCTECIKPQADSTCLKMLAIEKVTQLQNWIDAQPVKWKFMPLPELGGLTIVWYTTKQRFQRRLSNCQVKRSYANILVVHPYMNSYRFLHTTFIYARAGRVESIIKEAARGITQDAIWRVPFLCTCGGVLRAPVPLELIPDDCLLYERMNPRLHYLQEPSPESVKTNISQLIEASRARVEARSSEESESMRSNVVEYSDSDFEDSTKSCGRRTRSSARRACVNPPTLRMTLRSSQRQTFSSSDDDQLLEACVAAESELVTFHTQDVCEEELFKACVEAEEALGPVEKTPSPFIVAAVSCYFCRGGDCTKCEDVFSSASHNHFMLFIQPHVALCRLMFKKVQRPGSPPTEPAPSGRCLSDDETTDNSPSLLAPKPNVTDDSEESAIPPTAPLQNVKKRLHPTTRPQSPTTDLVKKRRLSLTTFHICEDRSVEAPLPSPDGEVSECRIPTAPSNASHTEPRNVSPSSIQLSDGEEGAAAASESGSPESLPSLIPAREHSGLSPTLLDLSAWEDEEEESKLCTPNVVPDVVDLTEWTSDEEALVFNFSPRAVKRALSQSSSPPSCAEMLYWTPTPPECHVAREQLSPELPAACLTPTETMFVDADDEDEWL